MKQIVRVRASSLPAMLDCAARWQALQTASVPSRAAAATGTAIHVGTAVFDADRVAGVTPSISAAQDAAAESVKNPGGDVVWDEEKPDDAISIATSLVKRYCETESPKHEFAAVEATVESLVISDLSILLTGTTDRVWREPETGALGIADLKSGKRAVTADGSVETKGHASQLGVYELIAGAAIGEPMQAPAMVIGLQTNKTPDKQRIGTAQVIGAREVLVGDEHHDGLLSVVAKIAHGELSWGNPRSVLCDERFCPAYNRCFYRR